MKLHIYIFFLLIVLLFNPHSSYPHHTSKIKYIEQSVGTKMTKNFILELISNEPTLSKKIAKELTEKQIHSLLNKMKFTHLFNLKIERKNIKKKIKVNKILISFHHKNSKWSSKYVFFKIKKINKISKSWHVSLIPKGIYQIVVKIYKENNNQEITTFNFENTYDSLKNVMKDLNKTIKFLKKIRIKGIENNTQKNILQKIKFLKELVPWITFLREGDKQKLFEEKAEILRSNIRKAEEKIQTLETKEFFRQLSKIEYSCKNCHDIFREADKGGKRVE